MTGQADAGGLDDALRRLRLLEDERDVLDVLYRYAHAFDDRRYDDVLDCFTEDGAFVFVQRPDEAPLFERRGPDLRTFLEEHDVDRPWGDVTHAHINPRVTIHGDKAEVVSYYGTLQQRADRSVVDIFSMGRYFDSLVRCEDGVWRIRVRRAERDSPRPEEVDRSGETEAERAARRGAALGLSATSDS